MSVETHLAALEQKHAELEQMVTREAARPAPDSLRMTELKREKLRVKEEIERLTHH